MMTLVLMLLEIVLAPIFKLFLQKGCFLEELKIARVTPMYKADDANEIGNYRPISALPCFSKVTRKNNVQSALQILSIK